MRKTDFRKLLKYINPAPLTYTEWLSVGMALKEEGYSPQDWEEWSRSDSARYHPGECGRKWDSFNGSETPVTGGTIYEMAVNGGYSPPAYDDALDIDNIVLTDSDERFIDPGWIEEQGISEPENWDPVGEIVTYLDRIYEKDECVGYVAKCYKDMRRGIKYMPKGKGNFGRTSGELVKALEKCGGDIGKVLGDYNKEAGMWIRFNPLDKKGVTNENVTNFRFALVESDDMEIGKQNALLRELQLPIAVLVYSGGKSLHAIVHIGAKSYEEYKSRVNFLYAACEKAGMKIDKQNKNPSRLSRMPGVLRGKRKQFIVDTDIGKKNWDEWKEWYEESTDDLPDEESLADCWNDMPPLAPELIAGVLRKGHKMLVAGPSKAGKSFLLIELCIAIAEGTAWLGRQCAQGCVMYVNLELDRVSCLHRFKDTYAALGIPPNNIDNITIWNLRGRATTLDKLAPKLIRRAKRKHPVAVVIDPIYKIITGDENSADQMALFCNQFDRVCSEVGCATIYCHHHSKGGQWDKRAMDRASGSGVFARDPDAILDLIQIGLSEDLLKNQEDMAACRTCSEYLDRYNLWRDIPDLSEDDRMSAPNFTNILDNTLPETHRNALRRELAAAGEQTRGRTAWQIEGVFREFPPAEPVQAWFEYPVHRIDDTGILGDAVKTAGKSRGSAAGGSRAKKEKKEEAKTREERFAEEFGAVFAALAGEDGAVPFEDMAGGMGCSRKSIGEWLGNGSRQKQGIKKSFESCQPEKGGRKYVRRKS